MFPSSTLQGKKNPSHHPCYGSVMPWGSSFVWLLKVPYQPLFLSLNYWGIFSVFSPHGGIFAVSRSQFKVQMSPLIKLNKMELNFHSMPPLGNSQWLSSLIFGILSGGNSGWSAEARTAHLGELSRNWIAKENTLTIPGRTVVGLRRPAWQALRLFLFQPHDKLQKCTYIIPTTNRHLVWGLNYSWSQPKLPWNVQRMKSSYRINSHTYALKWILASHKQLQSSFHTGISDFQMAYDKAEMTYRI